MPIETHTGINLVLECSKTLQCRVYITTGPPVRRTRTPKKSRRPPRCLEKPAALPVSRASLLARQAAL